MATEASVSVPDEPDPMTLILRRLDQLDDINSKLHSMDTRISAIETRLGNNDRDVAMIRSQVQTAISIATAAQAAASSVNRPLAKKLQHCSIVGGVPSLLNVLPMLIISAIIDMIGFSSYFLPFLGEAFDLAWAPLSAFIVLRLHGCQTTALMNLAEELLPGTDIVPTACLGWASSHKEHFTFWLQGSALLEPLECEDDASAHND
mmetsp:Transcript_78552/g.168319  ORF Transcript_78552/g.168319 Transcript_78552/m.168319 type:complete len:205 (-) Transcript_78552:97-711(-)|eukprot:CAMPEP_0180418852 /NCGR_PEP_ID=MMETSP1036_2-20121128/1782_1 /TAXON_ID=632150 /ORGANISM="Azadinium spinosum, Strain 3D9" /LENGTH=204 /DNA_ID=CAMNT_0022423965 /DNA_START=15 /DNA_END=629 /DNA_ORIENTATION=-